jgi:SnoaL-like domain
MTPDQLWQRYSRIWSADRPTRTAELEVWLESACSYCDVNGVIEGREALSNYMEGFQQSVKGGRFRILSVINHHDRMLAEWELLGPGEVVLQTGRSFATLAPDGRLASITGFFDPQN